LFFSGTLTSDIAYYQNMLYNTGWSFSNGSFYFLYSQHDVQLWRSYTFLTEHFSPTLALLAPAYRLFPTPVMLSVCQPLAILAAGWGLFRLTGRLLADRGLSPGFGLFPPLILAAYLFNYSNVSATVDVLYGFHHDSLIPPLLIWAVVGVVEARWRVAAVLFGLCLGLKENLPIISSAGLLVCIVRNGPVPRKGAILGLLICALYFAGCYWMEFRTANRHVAIIHQFLEIDWEHLYVLGDRKVVLWSLVDNYWPGLLMPAFALPALADLCLQLMGWTNELDWHSYVVMAFGMLAMVGGVINVLSWVRRWSLLSLTILVLLGGGVLLPMIVDGADACVLLGKGAANIPRMVDLEAMKEVAAGVPRDAKLCTSSDLLVFFGDRHSLFWPEYAKEAQYVLINRRDKADNEAKARDFARNFSDTDKKNKAGKYFYATMDVVLRGYSYDEGLYAYVDQLQAAGKASLVRQQGSIALFLLHLKP
jgi:hypothetical protein